MCGIITAVVSTNICCIVHGYDYHFVTGLFPYRPSLPLVGMLVLTQIHGFYCYTVPTRRPDVLDVDFR